MKPASRAETQFMPGHSALSVIFYLMVIYELSLRFLEGFSLMCLMCYVPTLLLQDSPLLSVLKDGEDAVKVHPALCL